jgi:hypothetical protein
MTTLAYSINQLSVREAVCVTVIGVWQMCVISLFNPNNRDSRIYNCGAIVPSSMPYSSLDCEMCVDGKISTERKH